MTEFKRKRGLIALNLQTFSAEPPAEPKEPEKEPPAEPPKTPEQVEAERIEAEVKKRVEAEIARQKQEAEKKRLKDEGEFKALYEAAQAEIVTSRKTALLYEAGYDKDQVSRVIKYVSGDSAEEINASIAELMQDIPPKPPEGVDPRGHNPPKQPQKEPDYKELARSTLTRLGRIKPREV